MGRQRQARGNRGRPHRRVYPAAARSAPYLREFGEAVAVMRQVKLALDPDNIMNPGKILTV